MMQPCISATSGIVHLCAGKIYFAAARRLSLIVPSIALKKRSLTLLLLRVLLLLDLLGQHRFDAPLLLDQERPDDAVTHALRAPRPFDLAGS